MEFSAIIAEYNPLTNGHLYHIQRTKKELGLPVICIMSGNFVQRGEASIMNKYTRAKHAILAGADLVIELPTVFALSNAIEFAFGAVRTLSSLGCVKYLSFGSESGDIETLKKAAVELSSLKKSEIFFKQSKAGKSYASSVIKCVSEEVAKLIEKPNNILAIEYLKALSETKSEIIPYTIKREDNYNEFEISGKKPSASALRKLILASKKSQTKKFSPAFTFDDIEKINEKYIKYFKNCITFAVLKKTTDQIKEINEVTEGLEFRLHKAARETNSYSEFSKKAYTKRYKNSKIDRIVIQCALDITKELVQRAKVMKPYAKILAIRESLKKDIFRSINQETVSIITKRKDYTLLDADQRDVVKIDIFASEVSSLAHRTNSNLDYTIGTIYI